MKKLLSLKPEALQTHPRNMRRFYPSEQVREMASSILASGGVLEPLIITKDGSGKWIVVDGNMRLAGARLLGAKCPPLDCKVVDQSRADQLLSMIVANQVRYDIDAVSEGLHYKRLQDEGLSVRDISKRTGVYEKRITDRKLLAELDEPIQKLIVEGKLPISPEAAKAFLLLESAVRVKLAERLAQNPNLKITTLIKACESLTKSRGPAKKLKRPAVELSGAETVGSAHFEKAFEKVRAAARKACQSCNQYEGRLADTPEPAWAMVVHAADDTCNACPLKEMQKVCASCPAVDLLRKLVAVKGEPSGRPH